jgi:hypothetical protein
MTPYVGGYRPTMSQSPYPDDREIHHGEVPEGAQPVTNQPLNADPRPRLSPAIIAGLLVAAVVVIILALTLI